jgi:hypothetical protein
MHLLRVTQCLSFLILNLTDFSLANKVFIDLHMNGTTLLTAFQELKDKISCDIDRSQSPSVSWSSGFRSAYKAIPKTGRIEVPATDCIQLADKSYYRIQVCNEVHQIFIAFFKHCLSSQNQYPINPDLRYLASYVQDAIDWCIWQRGYWTGAKVSDTDHYYVRVYRQIH